MATCTATADDPFIYKNSNGTQILNGTLSDDGVCVFLDADCSTGPRTHGDCCDRNPRMQNQLQSMLQNIGPFWVYMVLVFIFVKRKKAADKRREAEHAAAVAEAERRGAPPPVSTVAADGDHFGVNQLSKCEKVFGIVGYVGALCCAVSTPIIMMSQIQSVLHPASRSAVLAAGAFLTPLEEVFAFLEDTMTVRINFAMGAGDRVLTNRLFNAGILIGLVSGTLAALVATFLAIDPDTFQALVYPEAGYEAAHNLSSCSLVPHASEVAYEAKPFFLLSAWQWPFVFANKRCAALAACGSRGPRSSLASHR